MFVGHYAVAFALKGKEKNTSLGWLFIAVQLVDILFFPLAVLGIESLKFEEGFTEVNNFKMEFYPFTHGLLGSLIWALLFYVLFKFVIAKNKINSNRVAVIMAIAVLSHWFADLLVHTPDLPLINGEPKFGFGLWNYKAITFFTEAVLLLLGLWYYLKKTRSITKSGKYAASIFSVLLILVNYLNMYVLPPNNSVISLTISALFLYFLFAGIAFYVDKKRI